MLGVFVFSFINFGVSKEMNAKAEQMLFFTGTISEQNDNDMNNLHVKPGATFNSDVGVEAGADNVCAFKGTHGHHTYQHQDTPRPKSPKSTSTTSKGVEYDAATVMRRYWCTSGKQLQNFSVRSAVTFKNPSPV